MDDSSVEEEMESTKSKIKSVEEEIESVKSEIESLKSEIKSIKSTLGITSENVLGNTNHLQYNELKSMLSSKENMLSSKENVMSSKENRLSQLYKLLVSSSVDRLVKAYRSIGGMNASPEARPGRGILCDPSLQEKEVTATALLARELDRFLFSDTSKAHGTCLHQLPVACPHHTPERADFYIVELGTDDTDGLPERPIGVADYKNIDFQKACVESFGYSTRLMQNRCNDETFVAQLVFPASKDMIKLELHVGLSEKVLVIEISKVSLHSSEIGSFFAFCMQQSIFCSRIR